MAQSLFTSQTPSSANNSDGTPGITVGTTIRFAVAGTVSGIRFYATTTVGGTYTGALYQVTAADSPSPAGTLLASKTLAGSPTGGAWNTITFDTPVSVSTGVLYRAALFSGDGRYVYSAGLHASDIVNGDLTADANGDDPIGLGTLRQATFTISASLAYPSTGAGSNGSYFADLLFDASGAGSATPAGLAISTALGTPTVSQSLTAAPTGIAVARALGTPAVTLAGVAPTGLAIPVTLGQPATTLAAAAPTGLTVSTGLGQPTVSQSLTAAPSGLVVPVALGQPVVTALAGSVAPSGLAVPVTLGQPTVETPAAPASPTVSGWSGLMGILSSARQDEQEERARGPEACPNDGEPLKVNVNGVLYCPYDGWSPDAAAMLSVPEVQW